VNAHYNGNAIERELLDVLTDHAVVAIGKPKNWTIQRRCQDRQLQSWSGSQVKRQESSLRIPLENVLKAFITKRVKVNVNKQASLISGVYLELPPQRKTLFVTGFESTPKEGRARMPCFQHFKVDWNAIPLLFQNFFKGLAGRSL
jgi:hypothetical protein